MDPGTDSLPALARGKRLIVFDMDNTLMDESRYLFAGYKAVARVAFPEDPVQAAALAAWLKDRFRSAGRQQLFDRMREQYPQAAGTLADWLGALRTVAVELPLASWVEPFCAAVPETDLAILTNGNVIQQRNKYLGLSPVYLRDRMRLYCAAEIESKPSPAGLRRILEDHHCEPEAALMIGDTGTDARCAQAAGVAFAWAPPL